MWPYLLSTAETQLLNTISVYATPGKSREQVRLLYMNEAALRTWKLMGKQPTAIGEAHRPPASALLAFGKPFSE